MVPREDAPGVARSVFPRAAPDHKGSVSDLDPLRVCSRALMCFLASAALRLTRIDSSPVSTVWQP